MGGGPTRIGTLTPPPHLKTCPPSQKLLGHVEREDFLFPISFFYKLFFIEPDDHIKPMGKHTNKDNSFKITILCLLENVATRA